MLKVGDKVKYTFARLPNVSPMGKEVNKWKITVTAIDPHELHGIEYKCQCVDEFGQIIPMSFYGAELKKNNIKSHLPGWW